MSIAAKLPDLPVRAVLPEIAAALAANRPVVLQAPPGSGKTTLVAPSLLDAPWLAGRRILLLEPRRLAARAAARFMAGLLDEEPGGRVGYHIRLERQVGPRTRIEVLTEGLLTQRLLNDPELADTALVIFDEFHERSVAADMGLALALDVRRALRPDLRIIVMSATLETESVARHLGPDTAVVTSDARTWPVETVLLPRASTAPCWRQAAEAVRRAVVQEPGSVLVFLPGEGEIRRTEALLRETPLPPEVAVLPLYAALTRQTQDEAVAPPAPGRRKVVLATSIAESSITIQGIRVVIDTGWMRVPRFSPASGMARLDTLRITRDRADQRRGRAGRLGPGVCYRLWDEVTDHQLAPAALPEILDADLAPLVLQAAEWGSSRRDDLPWLTPPADAAWRQATALLRELGALDAAARITPRGRAMAQFPLHPRLSHMILEAESRGRGVAACLLAAAVSEAAGESTLRQETDARRLLDRLVRAPASDGYAQRVHELARRWRRHVAPEAGEGSCRDDDAGSLLAYAFPDRIARRRDQQGHYATVAGFGAALDTADPLCRCEWLVIAELQDAGPDSRIRLAAPFDPAQIDDDFAELRSTRDLIQWDRRTDSVVAVRRQMLGELLLREGHLPDPDPDAVVAALMEGVRIKGAAQLAWGKTARALQERLLFVARALPEVGWPDVSDDALGREAAAWLAPAAQGMTRWEHLQRVDLYDALVRYVESFPDPAGRLPSPGCRRQALDRLAPTHFVVPSGSRCAIRYDLENPYVAVRIQEVFGLTATPRIADGRVPVVLHLLSPAQHPVQVTHDLESFWNTGYAFVRKDLRGRYPKHYWPEDPRQAEPTARVRPRPK